MSANHDRRAGHARTLLLALALIAAFMVAEGVAALLTGSLVLLADAAHMLTDVAGISLALGAFWLARRPASESKTYGYYRAEILAALANAFLLLAVGAYIIYEAAARLGEPTSVEGLPVLLVASAGLLVNLAGLRLLKAGADESLNVRGAFLEMLGDMLASVAAIAAGVIVLATGWRYADPLFSLLVAGLILPRTWWLLRAALNVLFEGTPADIDLRALRRRLAESPGVLSVHDLHVWSVTSGFVALSGHLTVDALADRDRVLRGARAMLLDEFGIGHVTLQLETADLHLELDQPCLGDEQPCYPAPEAVPGRAVREPVESRR
jgi:cobalt-zinc-cadmium efflux system protein